MFRLTIAALQAILLAFTSGIRFEGRSDNLPVSFRIRDTECSMPRDEFTGTWEVVELVRGDLAAKVLPEEDMAGIVEIDGDHFRFIKTSLGQELDRVEAKVTVDYSRSPGWIELTFVSGPDRGRTAAGIFELNGDEAQLCFPIRPPFDDRPTEFTAGQGSNRILFTLRRSKGPI